MRYFEAVTDSRIEVDGVVGKRLAGFVRIRGASGLADDGWGRGTGGFQMTLAAHIQLTFAA